MYHSIVIEESLKNKDILKEFKILNTKVDEDWHLHILEVPPEKLEKSLKLIQENLVEDKPYYFHFFNDGKDLPRRSASAQRDEQAGLIIVFRKKVFKIDPRDKSTWQKAREYGSKVLNIPTDQLDFYPTRISDEGEWMRK